MRCTAGGGLRSSFGSLRRLRSRAQGGDVPGEGLALPGIWFWTLNGLHGGSRRVAAVRRRRDTGRAGEVWWCGTVGRRSGRLSAGRGRFPAFLGRIDPDLFCLGIWIRFPDGLFPWWSKAMRRRCGALRWWNGWEPVRARLWWLHGLRWLSFWTVEVEGGRVGSWSQVGEWFVKPSLKWLLGRRRLLLEVLAGSIPGWSRDGKDLAVMRLLSWGSSFFRVGEAWGCDFGFQGAGSGLSSPVLQRLLFILLFSLLVLLFVLRLLVVGSASQISNKSILFRVSVVVVVSGKRIDLGCWLVVRIQSYLVFVLGFHYQPVLRRKGDPGIARPIVFYWLVPILVSATYFGPMYASSGPIRLWLLDPLTRLSLLVGVRSCVISVWCCICCKPRWVL